MVAAISMVKDEQDIIGATVAHMCKQVDLVLVADNGSTDDTREILEALGVSHGVIVVDDPEPGYYQAQKMSALAQRVADWGAEWVVPFDADELIYSPFGRIGDVLAERPEAIATSTLYDHVATALDPDEANPVARIGWRRKASGELPKVACRANLPVTIHMGNHDAGYDTSRIDGLLVTRHFPYRSAEQFVRKARNGAAAYSAAEGLPSHYGQHWTDYGRILAEHGPEALQDVFRQWFWSPDPTRDPTLIFDPCPQ